MAEGVDVLTLTASPIPRTLEMALTGIRDLSMVNTPPADRRPILTYVGEHDDRGRQRGAAARAAARGPGLLRAQPGVRHRRRGAARRPRAGPRGPGRRRPRPDGRGQPRDRWCSTSGSVSYDVLVCTTIIESGIDMPSVNTLDRRPGRPARAGPAAPDPGPGRPRRASAPTPTCSTRPTGCSPSRPTSGCAPSASTPSSVRASRSPCATWRSGGPATCWARDQSGHIAAVGYDLYVQLVAEAVAEARGEPRPTPPTVALDVPGDAHLPEGLRGGRGRPASRPTAAWPRPRPSRRRRHRRRVGWTATAPCPRAGRGAPGPGPAAGRAAWPAASARSP